MLRCASVFTYEIDDPDVALNEIKKQLEEKITLLEHSVGIVMCHPEFISTGVLKHICENLPFDLAGVTTSSQAVNDGIGELILTIFVMTSDDVWFRTGVAENLKDEVEGPLKTAYESVTEGVRARARLVVVFPPFGLRAGDVYVRAWETIVPGAPVFGTLATDDSALFSECETIYNGKNYKTGMSFLLCYGNIHPRFLIATLSENSAVSSKIFITKAVDNRVYEIDNKNALGYFEEKGVAGSVMYSPFLIDQIQRKDYDGIPVIRGFASFMEEGVAVFHGDIEEGSTMTLLKCDPEDIVSITRRKASQINDLPNVNGAILFPCVVRRMTLLGINKPLMELESAKDAINHDIPFMIGYAGGEICPTSSKNGVPRNRFHNYSLVILVV